MQRSQARILLPILALPVLLALLLAPALFWSAASAQVRPVYSRGIVGLVQVLHRLQTTGSLMHTAAHPDDEDTALIARVARGDHARVAYLSLNRGEGGQNIIGLELYDALGVVRTEELLQARTLDGGEQLFTTAYDFGFTKTMEEAATKWGEERILGDMVRAIRLYRPLVIVSRFSGTQADGHGQHQLAGKLTPLAYAAAADRTRFPEHFREGLRPWQAKKLYVGLGFRAGAEAATLRLPTGVYDPLLGRTYAEIAMEGRSQHKTQEMGTIERRGPQTSAMRLVASSIPKPAGDEHGVFDGLDTSVRGLARLVGLPDGALKAELGAMEGAVSMAVRTLDVRAPLAVIPALADGLRAARAARSTLKGVAGSEDARYDADTLLAYKEAEFEEALFRAAGVTVDALADRETAAPGESLRVDVHTYVPDVASGGAGPSATGASRSNPPASGSRAGSVTAKGRFDAVAQGGSQSGNDLQTNGRSGGSQRPIGAPVKLSAVSVRVPAGWEATHGAESQGTEGGPMARFFRETPTRTDSFSVRVSKSAPFATPFWLQSPRKGYVFEWTDPATKNRPVAPPVVSVKLAAEIGGVAVTMTRPVEYRNADAIRGEIRRPFTVVPALTVAFDEPLEIVPLTDLGKPRRIAVRLQNQTLRNPEGAVRLTLPPGWLAEPAEARFSLKNRGERTAVFFTLTPKAGTPAGASQLVAEAVVGTERYRSAMRVIEYPHIQTHRLYDPAVAAVRVIDLKIAPVRVGYVMGSGDQVPDAIRRMGLDVTLLDPDQLTAGDLSRFDTIVVGVRASESRPEFVSNNGRLLQFVRDGGTLIVQYQQTDYVTRGLAPLPAEMPSRVTDEAAPVTILEPTHPRFTFPNRITEEDWKGWVHERNLYAFTSFDPQYVPLLETRDPGEPPQRGGEVYLRLGKGHYVYTSYAWFRQLPAGVPGAYRLFANLLSLPKADAPR
jgi:LmbE family N-acetylglucosaminyl deacetylase